MKLEGLGGGIKRSNGVKVASRTPHQHKIGYYIHEQYKLSILLDIIL